MSDDLFISSDLAMIDLLRSQGEMTVSELSDAMQVTATAVRQRLTRLMGQDYVERSTVKAARGRPSHFYRLTDKGRRKSGANFADLAIALWQEIRAIKDPEVRRGLMGRLAKRLALMYASQINGRTLAEKMESLTELFGEREVPFRVEQNDGLPVLTASACPYPGLAEQDRSVCAMERMMVSEILGEDVRLTRCRLDGDTACSFEAN